MGLRFGVDQRFQPVIVSGKAPLAHHHHQRVACVEGGVALRGHGSVTPLNADDQAVAAPVNVFNALAIQGTAQGEHIGLEHLFAGTVAAGSRLVLRAQQISSSAV